MTAIAPVRAEPVDNQPVYRVSLTFGHKTASGAPVSPVAIRSARALVKATFNQLCGGSCMNHHFGSYRHADGCDVDERGTTLWSFGFGIDVHLPQLRQLASNIARTLDQRTVMLAVERFPGIVLFIGQHDSDGAVLESGDRNHFITPQFVEYRSRETWR